MPSISLSVNWLRLELLLEPILRYYSDLLSEEGSQELCRPSAVGNHTLMMLKQCNDLLVLLADQLRLTVFKVAEVAYRKEDYLLWCDTLSTLTSNRFMIPLENPWVSKLRFSARSLIIFSAPDESNRNSSPAYFLLDIPRELRHIHRLAGGRHPINHEKLAPYLLLLASSLKSMSRLLDRWATQGWAYLFLAWPAIIIEKIQIRVLRLLEVLQILSSSLKGQFIKTML